AAPVPAFMASGMSILGEIIYEHVPVSRVIPEGWDQTWYLITGTVDMIRDMATNGVDTSQLTGPIGMGQLTSEVIKNSPDPVWAVASLAMLISISLGILNLLPLPALDGGRLMFVILEIVRGGKRIAPEKEGLVHLAGMVLLIGLMFFIAFGDISRIIDGKSILP
ncbi:MAG TPA: site-2 protease family protein, partial [Thermomicrobiales bacterium]|nr:site-2 protease family protein [Thermomicrobiales bacterium]